MAIDAPVARTAIEEIEQAAGRARVISRAGPGNPWYRA
jgi:hypothetical protein